MARHNLAYNPSFRLGIDGYSAVGGASLSIRGAGGFYGNEALYVTKAAVNGSGVQGQSIPVTAGLDYAYSAYVAVPVTVPASDEANLVLSVSWYTAVGALLSTSTSEVVTAVQRGGWSRLTGVDAAPIGASFARLSVTQLTAGRAKQPFLLDAILFEQSSYVGGYLDNVSEAQHQHAQQRGLSAYPQDTIGGLQLNADIILGDLVFNTIDENDILWVCSDLAGWWGQSEPDITDIKRGVEDGSYDVTGRYNARSIVLTGSFLLPDPALLGKARDILVTATNLVRKGAWLRTNEEPTRAAYVHLTGKPNIETVNARGRTDFSFTLRAADPIRYEWNDEDPQGLSSDILAVDPQVTNLAINPSFERLAASTVVSANYIQNPTGDGTISSFQDSTLAVDPITSSRAYRFTTDVATVDSTFNLAAQRPSAAPGQVWWSRARLHLDPSVLGARQVQLTTRFRDASGNALTGLPINDTTPSGIYNRWTGTANASTSEQYTTTGKRTNEIVNPGFNANTSWWTLGPGMTWTVVNGRANVQIASKSTASFLISPKMPCVPGQVKSVQAQVWNNTATDIPMRLNVNFYDSTGQSLTFGGVPYTTVPANGNVVLTRAGVTVPAAAATYTVEILPGAAPSNGDVFQFDNILSENASTVGSYFDGGTANTYNPGTTDLQIVPTGTLYRWQGTVNNSPSERWMGMTKYINVIPNPAAEGASVSLSSAGADVSIAQSPVFNSNAYLAQVQPGRGDTSAGTVYQQDAIVPGQPWSARARAHLAAGINGPRRLQTEIAWLDASSALISTSQGTPVDIIPTGTSHFWTGAAGASPSQEWVGTTQRVNLISNPSMENATTNGYAPNPFGPSGTLTATTERAYSGTYSGKYVAAGGANEGISFTIPPVLNNEPMALSAYVYIPSGGFPKLQLTALEDSGRQLEIHDTQTVGAWERIFLYIPENWTGGTAFLYLSDQGGQAVTAGWTFNWDAVMFGDYDAYFDGSTPSTTDGVASTQVVDLAVQGTAPANAARALWRVYRTADLGSSETDSFYVDQAMLAQMPAGADQSYFDGNTPSTGTGNNASIFDITSGSRAPSGAVTADMTIVRNSSFQAAVGDVVWFDNAMLTQQAVSTAPPYFDGNSATDEGGYFYGWASTQYGSVSQKTLPLLSGGITGSDALVLQSTAWYSRGSYAMEVRPTGSVPGVSYADITATVADGLEAGKQYTLAVQVHRETASLYSGALSYTGLLNQTPLSTTTTLIPAAAGTWLLTLTFTTPDISNAHQLRFYNNDIVGGSSLWFDELIIVEGTTVPNYFDGDTSDEDNVIYYWSGAANNSSSVRAPGAVVTRSIMNIGTADVTATFEIEGPLGPGSTITNAANGQVITTVDELRGIGGTAAITNTELNNEIATITTDKPHGLEVGDVVVVSGAGTPYDSTSANPTYTVTAVTDLIPYTFNYVIPGYPDLDSASSSGQVGLANNDVLSLDTYDHSVIFNDTSDGNRSRIATLVDWMQLAPGENLLTLSDNAARKKATTKKAASGLITITTDDPHFFIPGEDVVVNLPVNADIATKSLTNNVVTITTVGNHGFSIGDKITVTSTESSVISSKAMTSNVATIGTDAAGGFSVGDLITVSLPTTASISAKASVGNTATLTTAKAHGFSIGDVVSTAFLTSATITAKTLVNGTATITTSAAHGYSIGDTITVTLPTAANVIAKYRSGNNVVLTTDSAHGFSVGDRMTVNFPVAATLTNVRQMSGTTTYYATLNTTSAHGFAVGDRVSVNTGIASSWSTMARQATTSALTVTTNGNHNITVGETVVLSGMGNSQYNGQFTVSAITANTLTFSNAGDSYTAEAFTGDSAGTVVDDTIATGYNGVHIVEAIPSSTSFNVLYYGQTTSSTNTKAASTAGTVTNTTNTAVNGTYPIASVPSATQYSYQII